MAEKSENEDLVQELQKQFWLLRDEKTPETDAQAEKLATILEQIKGKGTQDEKNAVIYANKDYLLNNVFSSGNPAFSKISALQPSKREFQGGKPEYSLDELMDFSNAEKSGEDYTDEDRAKFVSDFEQNKNMSTPQLRLYARTAGMSVPDFTHAIAEKATDFKRGLVSGGYDPATGEMIPLEKAASVAQGVVLPRTKEAVRSGESPTTGAVIGDVAEDVVDAIPFGRVASAAPKIGKLYSLLQKTYLGRWASRLAESAAAPLTSAVEDKMIYDKGTYRGDRDAEDAAAQVATGTALNMSLPIIARALVGRAGKIANKGKSDPMDTDVISDQGAVMGAKREAAEAAEAATEIDKPIIYRADPSLVTENYKSDKALSKSLSAKADRRAAAIEWARRVARANPYSYKQGQKVDYQLDFAKDAGLIDKNETGIAAQGKVRSIISEFPEVLQIMNPRAAANERLSAIGVSAVTNKMRDTQQFRDFTGMNSLDDWRKKKKEEKKKASLRDYYRQLNDDYQNALESKFGR